MSGIFGQVILITGKNEKKDEFLVERAVAEAVKQIRKADSEIEVEDLQGEDITSNLANYLSPSLFSNAAAIVVRNIANLNDDAAKDLVSYAANPLPDVAVVLVHFGGQRGKGLLDKLRKQSGVIEQAVAAPKWDNERIAWVRKAAKNRMDDEAATYLVRAVGEDLRSLAAAVDQLLWLLPEKTNITIEVVRQYFGGRAEVKNWDIADAAIEGNIPSALEQLRWAQTNRVSPVLVTAAFAHGLRSLIKLHGAGAHMTDGELAAFIGAPPSKVKILRKQLRFWDEDGLKKALNAVADADLAVKGMAANPDYALERMVITVARSRS